VVLNRDHRRRACLSGAGREYRERMGDGLDYAELFILLYPVETPEFPMHARGRRARRATAGHRLGRR